MREEKEAAVVGRRWGVHGAHPNPSRWSPYPLPPQPSPPFPPSLEVDLASSNATLAPAQQAALQSIYDTCCPPPSPASPSSGAQQACESWRALSAPGAPPALDFCGVSGHLCSPGGSLVRLNLAGYGLACPVPAAALASFPTLTTLNLARNPGLTGSPSSLFDALAKVPTLRFVNLYRCTGLAGPLVSGSGAGGGSTRRLAQDAAADPLPGPPATTTVPPGPRPTTPARIVPVVGSGGARGDGSGGSTLPPPRAAPLVGAGAAGGGLPTAPGPVMVPGDAATPAGTGPFARRPTPAATAAGDVAPTRPVPVAAPTPPTPASVTIAAPGRGLCRMVANGLAALDAARVGLTGSIPACLTGPSSRLVELHLGNNGLTGSLPAVDPASPLQALTAYGNSLTGPIPPSLAAAPSLRLLDVADNALTGAIPAAAGRSWAIK